MAVDRETNGSKDAEGDELSALAPEATEASALDAEEPMDVGALAALSGTGRRAADGQARPVSDSPPEEARLNLAALSASAQVATTPVPPQAQPSEAGTPPVSAARSASTSGVGGVASVKLRGWLPLLIGVALGAAVSAMVFYRTGPSAPGAQESPSVVDASGAEANARSAVAVSEPDAVLAAPSGGETGPARERGGETGVAAASTSPSPSPSATPSTSTSTSTSVVQRGPVVGARRAVASGNQVGPGKSPAGAAPASESAAVIPPSDSEEARLAAAAAVPQRASQNPIDGVLDDAFASRQAQATKALAGEAPLPLAPSRDDVTKAMTVLVPAIRGCAQGQSGLATAAIVVRNDGKVESVALSGSPFAGTASGRCMEGVVRRARFPRFRQPAFRVQFPFAMQ